MDEIFEIIKDVKLFENIEPSAYPNVLTCLEARKETFEKGAYIIFAGEQVKYAGIILSGEVETIFYNESGAQHRVKRFLKGEMFGEAFACVPEQNSTVNIIANKKSEILLLNIGALFSERACCCKNASQVSMNLLKQMAEKNIFLNQKIEILAQKKIREKLKAYLRALDLCEQLPAVKQSKTDLAYFLGVERSALSRELCLMRDEGIIKMIKDEIYLLDHDFLE